MLVDNIHESVAETSSLHHELVHCGLVHQIGNLLWQTWEKVPTVEVQSDEHDVYTTVKIQILCSNIQRNGWHFHNGLR